VKYVLISPLSGKSSWVQAALAEYGEKIRQWRKWDFVLVTPARSEELTIKRAEESERISKVIPASSVLILFDERGKTMSSEQWAGEIQRLENRGAKALAFVIGGAYGVSEELRKKADLVVSMSPWVLNHQVALVVAAEQIYRALTLIHGHPYHHE
jgi:23S rRNA (pseudouridine1915-N3)-methyltransferase